MRKLVKDSEDNVVVLVSPNGFIPEGWTEIPAEEVEAEELSLARISKMIDVRNRRDNMLKEHDKQFLIAQKTSADTTQLLADYAILLDIPEDAETAIDAMSAVEDIQAHDAFSGAGLAGDYE